MPVPDAFLIPCYNPGLEAIVTNGDLANRVLAYDTALTQCSARAASLKELLKEPAQGD